MMRADGLVRSKEITTKSERIWGSEGILPREILKFRSSKNAIFSILKGNLKLPKRNVNYYEGLSIFD